MKPKKETPIPAGRPVSGQGQKYIKILNTFSQNNFEMSSLICIHNWAGEILPSNDYAPLFEKSQDKYFRKGQARRLFFGHVNKESIFVDGPVFLVLGSRRFIFHKSS